MGSGPTKLEISGRLLARNSLINFFGQAIPLIVGVITIPSIVRGLGVERFGLLSLAWVVLGYFTIFDLGLGRATTKYVAEALGKGEEDRVPRLIWTSITVQAVLGAVGGLILFGITPLLLERVLNIPPNLLEEGKIIFQLLALAIPIVLISSSFSGVLEALQRFDLLNSVRIPSSTFTFLMPLIGLVLGFRLSGIVGLILISKFISLLFLVIFDFRIFPRIGRLSISFVLFPHLVTYGGWITISSIIGPILLYLDRFLITSLVSLTAVAYYTAPYEALTRLWIIPISLTVTLFPVFSALDRIRDQEKVERYFFRSIKYVFIILGPIVLALLLFARKILQIWLGNDFAIQSTGILQILAIGILINSLAHIPYAFLQGTGRPDIPAKLHFIELPIHFGIALIFIHQWGITGAAIAWTIRVTLDTFLLFMATFKISRMSPRLLTTAGLPFISLAFLLAVILIYGLRKMMISFPLFVQYLIFVLVTGMFLWMVWKKVLDSSDRKPIIGLIRYLEGSKTPHEK